MEHQLSAIELLIKSYNTPEEKHLDNGTHNEARKEGDTTNFAGEKQERELTAIEKMMNGYNSGLQVEKEINVDLNDVKDKEVQR